MNSRWIKALRSSEMVWPLLLLLLGLCLTLVVSLWSKRQLEYRLQAELERSSLRVSNDITQRFNYAYRGLVGVRGMFASRGQVSRQEFQAYMASLDLVNEFHGVRGFGFIQQVGRDGLSAFVAAQRADDAPQFSVYQLGDKGQAELYVISLIVPVNANARAEGLDVGSEPLRRAAIQRAIDTGEPIMTPAISLVQDDRKTPGVLLYLPYYKAGASLESAAERRAALRGVLYAPIVMSELLHATAEFSSQQIHFELFEGATAGAKETLYYDSGNHLAKPGSGQSVGSEHLHLISQALPLFGQALSLRVHSLPAFEAMFDHTVPWLIWVAGTLLSAAGALLLRLQTSGLQRSEQRAREMTKQLRQEEERWRDFSASASDWFWETDAEHFYTFISESFERFYGLPVAHWLGRNSRVLLETDTLNAPEVIKERLLNLEKHLPLERTERQMRVADGSVRWLINSGVPKFDADGRFCGYRGNGTDITKRKNAEAAAALLVADISSLNQRLTLATDSAQIGIWDLDILEDKLHWDMRMYALYGMREEDFSGAYAAWRAGLHPDDVASSDTAFAQALRGEKDIDAEFRIVWPNGTVRHLQANALVLRDDKGAPLRMIGINYDITERKRIEAHMTEAHLQADSANLAKSNFLANMSHEIRSPLNAILGLAYLLEQASLAQEPRQMVRKIRDSGRLLLGIITDILDVSKIEAGQLQVEQSSFVLSTLIDKVAVATRLAIERKNIELIISPLPLGIGRIVGDALRLQQVLTNLCSNAAKFTPSGRIELRIDLQCRDDGAELLRFAVMDTGIGIAPEAQECVFSAFAQADSSTSRRFGGSGLGLTICRQLVSLMGGEIGVVSELGKGSEFWFSLPLQRAASASYAFPTHVVALIVDDRAIAMDATRALALSLNWNVSVVDSGAAAVAHVLACKADGLPNVVVLDWEMPGMDALAAARAIRAAVPLAECPIVLMATASALTALADQAGVEEVDARLAKPVTSSSLYNAVMQGWRHRAKLVGGTPPELQTANEGLAGVRLLVVDDSDINRDVAKRILEGEGALVALAEDGQQAIDWLLAHPLEVDLVLMDVQMPVLDGMEATRRLRCLPEFDELPIVALTAGAFKTQQQDAMAAGMTEFVSKPFDVALTVALIRRLRRPSKLSAVTPVLVMDAAQGLAIWSDLPIYQTYLRRFAGSHSDDVETIRARLASSDRPGAAALAHKLSGVAANLALPETRRAAQQAERLLATQDDAEPALAELSNALAAVLAEIHRYAPPVEAASAAVDAAGLAAPALSAAAQAALKKQLAQFLLALDSDDPVRIKSELKALEQLLPAPALAALWLSVLGYDFRAAEAQTQQLAIAYALDFGE